MADDPLYQPLRSIGVDEPGIRRLLKQTSRHRLQQWIRITDAALHESPSGFPGFKTSPAAFLVDAIQNKRLPPDWLHAHNKKRDRQTWQEQTDTVAHEEAALRKRYQHERESALQAYLKLPEGIARFTAYRTTLEILYQRIEPERYRQAAQEAAHGKVEREHFTFPDFGVWLLEHRHQQAH